MSGYSENVTIDEGIDAYGTRTQVHFQGESLIVQKSFDAQPLLEQCHAERVATEGQRWGEMRKVATIPMAVYAKALAIKENTERIKFFRNWIAQNPAFKTFDRYGK